MKKVILPTIIAFALGILFLGAPVLANGQNQKPLAAVLGIDSKGVIQDAAAVGYMVRLELEKANVYSMMDKYDIAEQIKKNSIDIKTCFGKTCLVAAGKSLGVDKMISGSIDRFGEKIVISLKIIDIKTESVEKENAIEYLNLQPELQRMIAISVQKLVGIIPDQNTVDLLIYADAPIYSPHNNIKLSGPRMGASMAFGDAAKVMKASEKDGGYNMYPTNFQIGWQFEKQYLSAGNFRALIEFIPSIGGLESGKIIPSLTFLNGFRMGKAGWEIAFGPNFRVVQKATSFQDKNNTLGGGTEKWYLANEWSDQYGKNPNTTSNHLDSRGSPTLSTALFIGFGRTFKSGYLNIPVNVYVVPRKEGTIVGFSFGFNIYKKPKNR